MNDSVRVQEGNVTYKKQVNILNNPDHFSSGTLVSSY